MTIEISETGHWRDVDRESLARAGDRLLEALDSAGAFASLHLSDDDVIHRMNRRFRHVDRPTDVLSFPSGEEGDEAEELGGIVISVETARRQARDLDETLMERMIDLLTHGVLHLHGFDHEGGGETEWDRAEGGISGVVRELKEEVRVRPRPGRTR